jgi:hypothetical protein
MRRGIDWGSLSSSRQQGLCKVFSLYSQVSTAYTVCKNSTRLINKSLNNFPFSQIEGSLLVLPLRPLQAKFKLSSLRASFKILITRILIFWRIFVKDYIYMDGFEQAYAGPSASQSCRSDFYNFNIISRLSEIIYIKLMTTMKCYKN